LSFLQHKVKRQIDFLHYAPNALGGNVYSRYLTQGRIPNKPIPRLCFSLVFYLTFTNNKY